MLRHFEHFQADRQGVLARQIHWPTYKTNMICLHGTLPFMQSGQLQVGLAPMTIDWREQPIQSTTLHRSRRRFPWSQAHVSTTLSGQASKIITTLNVSVFGTPGTASRWTMY